VSWGNDQQIARYKDLALRKQLRGESAEAELRNIALLEERNRQEREGAIREEQRATERRMNDAADRRERERAAREEARFKEEQDERRRDRQREQDRREEIARRAYIQQVNEQALDDFVEEADNFMLGVKGNTSKYLPDHNDIGYLLHLWHWAECLDERFKKMEITPDDEYVQEIANAWEELGSALSRQGVEDPGNIFLATQELLDNSWYVAYRKEFLEQNPFELPAGEIEAITYQQALEAFDAVVNGIDECAVRIRELVEQLGPKYVHQTKKGEWVWTERFRAHNNYMFFAPGVDPYSADQYQDDDRGRYFSEFPFCMSPEQVTEYLKPYRSQLVDARRIFEEEKKAQLELLEADQNKPKQVLRALQSRPIRFTDSPAWAELKSETSESEALAGGYLSVVGAAAVGCVTYVAGRIFESVEIRFLSYVAFGLAAIVGTYVVIKEQQYKNKRGVRAYQETVAWVDKLPAPKVANSD
jgi:hypothetical protein